ncbi:MAG: phosphate ABC transporter permease subunit PstC [Actinobacteria bacterium]|nr:phosphate ABC transporter permease subunit PstC [Actinomycetota bacterium]MBU1608017.1 phosphate ABC transporter permease subunit PstC [Actinomycetota bacterium]MBU2315911.1 phosphate ABC transporter permease subunit PstC [Actinomycetota bacterium]MBU2385911.1 phosphate ABC transporter permease subunit PstC [Actinomycetota bacterium]
MATSTITSPTEAPFSLESTRTRIGEKVIVAWLFLASTIAVLITIGIVISIILPTIEFFQLVPLSSFFSFEPWAPLFADPTYGVVYIVGGTFAIVVYSGIVGLPAGLGAAIYMSEYAGPRARKVLQPVLEILEGIPTVVYGIFALFFVGPIIKDNWPTWIPGKLGEEPGFQFLLAAGLVLGVMLIPTVASVAYDSMNAVPRALREAAYGLGGTRMQVATRVVVPSALSGIIASFVLGLSRAVGETIVVLMAAGAMANLTLWPNDAILTMTAFIGRTATGDISTGSVAYFTVFAVGALLFLITLTVNLIAIALVRRFREAYE